MNASINAVSPLLTNETIRSSGEAAEVSLTIPGARENPLDLPSTPDSTDTLQSEFRFRALGTKGSRRKLTKETVRRLGEAAEVSLTIPGARENFSTYPVPQIALTLCRVNSGLALWRRKRKILDLLSTPDSTNTLQNSWFWCSARVTEVSLTKPVHRRELFFIKLIKSDSYLVIGVSGRPQNFYCDLYLVRGISAAFSRVLLAFHYSFFILFLSHKVSSL
ncbi:hypothetical protein PUN28_020706 [Cardiocondyla obscurior]|uniref:Uncharacterized protein n=1 Tax=Cardiocondyla obscurior TaxID=286306 RepID=A0AAW2E707_9HYME